MPIVKATDSKKNGDFLQPECKILKGTALLWILENGDVDCFGKNTKLTLCLWLSCYCSAGVLFTVIWVLLMLTHVSCVLGSICMGFVFLTIPASKVLSLLYLDVCGRPGIKHQGAGAATARVSWCEDVRQCPGLGIHHGFFLLREGRSEEARMWVRKVQHCTWRRMAFSVSFVVLFNCLASYFI